MRDPTSSWEMQVYHDNLSANKKGKLLDHCVWQSLSDGQILDYPDEDHSIAQNLDIFQRELSQYTTRRVTVCAINVNTKDEFEHLASPDHVGEVVLTFRILLAGLKFCCTPSMKNFPDFQSLLKMIFEEHWNGCADKITEIVRETSERSKSPPQLSWTLAFPSQTREHHMTLQNHPIVSACPFQSIDIALLWMSEPPKLDKLLGSRDWNIYVSEPYTRRSTLEVLRLVDVTTHGSSNGQVLIKTTSHRMLTRLKHNINDAVNAKAIDISVPRIEDVLYGYVIACLDSALDDATDNLLQSVARTQELVCIIKRS